MVPIRGGSKWILFGVFVVLVFPSLGADASGRFGEEPTSWNDRYAVPLEDLALPVLVRSLELTGADLVRVDEHLGFAVVETTAPGRLERLLGVHLIPDAEGGAAWVPNDPRFTDQWALHALGMPAAWAIERGSRDVWVAVIDSGVDLRHEDLRDVAVRTGFDYVDLDLDPSDQSGHGTHVAGTIAASTNNGVGIAGMADVGLIVIRVLGAENRGSCLDFASAIAEAAVLGADVINLSLYCESLPVYLSAAVLFAGEMGAVTVAAAGNLWAVQPSACVTAPARHPAVIAVAAVDWNLNAASFSCRGAAVEIAAPGVSVLSTLPGDAYASWSGTSMATPHVAAVAALLLSHRDLDADEVRTVLQETARDLGAPGRDGVYGYGLVQPEAALQAVAAT